MNINSVAISLSNISQTNDVGTAVLAKSLDNMEASGAMMVEMLDAAAMENSVNPHIGGNFDVKI